MDLVRVRCFARASHITGVRRRSSYMAAIIVKSTVKQHDAVTVCATATHGTCYRLAAAARG
jgi:hypothetical protein